MRQVIDGIALNSPSIESVELKIPLKSIFNNELGKNLRQLQYAFKKNCFVRKVVLSPTVEGEKISPETLLEVLKYNRSVTKIEGGIETSQSAPFYRRGKIIQASDRLDDLLLVNKNRSDTDRLYPFFKEMLLYFRIQLLNDLEDSQSCALAFFSNYRSQQEIFLTYESMPARVDQKLWKSRESHYRYLSLKSVSQKTFLPLFIAFEKPNNLHFIKKILHLNADLFALIAPNETLLHYVLNKKPIDKALIKCVLMELNYRCLEELRLHPNVCEHYAHYYDIDQIKSALDEALNFIFESNEPGSGDIFSCFFDLLSVLFSKLSSSNNKVLKHYFALYELLGLLDDEFDRKLDKILVNKFFPSDLEEKISPIIERIKKDRAFYNFVRQGLGRVKNELRESERENINQQKLQIAEDSMREKNDQIKKLSGEVRRWKELYENSKRKSEEQVTTESRQQFSSMNPDVSDKLHFFGVFQSGKSISSSVSGERVYRRHPVDADGNCGYTAFGITREDAYQLLVDNVNLVRSRISPIVNQALSESDLFRNYLIENRYVDSGIANATILENSNGYAQDLGVQQGYINFDLQERGLDLGWAHPLILHAIAQIQNIELRLWTFGEEGVLTPHRREGYYDYHATLLENPHQELDLLFVNGNHFERLEFVNHTDDVLATASYSHNFSPS